MILMKKWLTFLALIVGIGIGVGYFGPFHSKKSECAHYAINESHCKIRRTTDRLWIEHLIWTRQFVVSEIAGLQDIAIVTERLLQNQDAIGDAIVPYYGKEAGAHLAQLLREHIILAGDIFKALLTKDDKTAKDLNIKWHENSADIAKFLHKLNPQYWDEKILTDALYKHLEGATQKLTLRANGDWTADYSNADKAFDGAQEMGKYFADGIAQQFPEKFKAH